MLKELKMAFEKCHGISLENTVNVFTKENQVNELMEVAAEYLLLTRKNRKRLKK